MHRPMRWTVGGKNSSIVHICHSIRGLVYSFTLCYKQQQYGNSQVTLSQCNQSRIRTHQAEMSQVLPLLDFFPFYLEIQRHILQMLSFLLRAAASRSMCLESIVADAILDWRLQTWFSSLFQSYRGKGRGMYGSSTYPIAKDKPFLL